MTQNISKACCRLCLAPETECVDIFKTQAADKQPIQTKINNCVQIQVSELKRKFQAAGCRSLNHLECVRREKSISVSVVGHMRVKAKIKEKEKNVCGADDETFVPSLAFECSLCVLVDPLTTGFCFRQTNDSLKCDAWWWYLQKKQDDNWQTMQHPWFLLLPSFVVASDAHEKADSNYFSTANIILSQAWSQQRTSSRLTMMTNTQQAFSCIGVCVFFWWHGWARTARRNRKIHEAENSPSAYTNIIVIASWRSWQLANWNRFYDTKFLFFLFISLGFWSRSLVGKHLSRMRQLLKLMAKLQESLWRSAEKTENLDIVKWRQSWSVAAQNTT